MKWWVRTFFVIVFAGFCSYKAMPVVQVQSGDKNSENIHYVALGDSISLGYGLEHPEKDGYVAKVRDYLKTKCDVVVLKNLSENGLQSFELLNRMTNRDSKFYNEYINCIKRADVITLSIGSNDLLHHITLDVDMLTSISKKKQIFDNACREFYYRFPYIIKAIREVNPDAKIYANNVYNPVKWLSTFHNVYDISEKYIKELNKGFYESKEYHLIDVKKAFDKKRISMINVTLFGGNIDPHPNKRGHKLIAKKVIEAMKTDE